MIDRLMTNKPPPPQLVHKATRMTHHKQAVLQQLADFGENFLEWGAPPYALSQLAEKMRVDISNLSKTMLALERAGLVVREVASVSCWNAISQTHKPRRCVCYWVSETLELDKARAQEWRAGAGERSNRALERMFARQGT